MDDNTRKKCDYCTFSFVGHAKYYNHARKDHSDIVSQTWEACAKCSKRFPDKKALDKHCDRKHRHEKHVCHVCCKEYVSKYRYILHANEKHKDMIKDVWEQCKTCLICYPDMKTLENHQQSAHLEDTYNYFHSESSTEVCQFCMAPCSSKANFYQHVSTYHQEHVASIWKKCDTCSMMFPDLPTLSMHKQSTHKKKGKSFTNSKNSKKICKFCSYQYEDLEQFYNHANAEHSDALTKTWLQCNKCSKYYPDRRTLYQHFKIHRDKTDPATGAGSNAWSEPYSQCQSSSSSNEPSTPTTQAQSLTVVQPAAVQQQPQIWSHVPQQQQQQQPQQSPLPPPTSDNNTCFICNESFTVTQAYYHHANFKHRDVLAKSWHLCQSCMWYYPTDNALRTHGCSLPIHNGHSNTTTSHKENPAPTTNHFGHPATAFTLYQPAPHHPVGAYGILGLPPQVSMQEFFIHPSNTTSQVTRDYLAQAHHGSNGGKSDFAELKNVSLNGWLDTSDPKNQTPLPQLIHHYPGYL